MTQCYHVCYRTEQNRIFICEDLYITITRAYSDSSARGCFSWSTFVSVFTIKCPWRLNGEDTEQMYSKHLSV